MGKIGLKGFEPIPQGKYSMKVVKVNHKEAFNKVELTYETATGKQHTEKFDLNINGGAWAFSITARNLLNDNNVDSIDPKDLIGKFALFEVTHEVVEYKGRDTVFARAKSYGHADGFVTDNDDEDEGEDEAEEAPAKKPNLADILGDD